MCEQTKSNNTRAEQARINGAKSRGPTTAAGKLKSSRNGLVHGVYANHAVLLDNEDADAFEGLHAAYQRRFEPRDPYEHNLVRELSTIDWSLIRSRTAQANLLNITMARQASDDRLQPFRRSEPIRLAQAYREAADSSRSLHFSQLQIDKLIRARSETLAALSVLREKLPSPERTQDTHMFQQLDFSEEPAETQENPEKTQIQPDFHPETQAPEAA
ncbi:MAG: hypothetical protein HY821_05320 [Acidobacteria bacterium]|nr:hypothetical protein [Acidobacteriota bacterium]